MHENPDEGVSESTAVAAAPLADTGTRKGVGNPAARPLRVLFVAGFSGDPQTGAGNAVVSLAGALRGRGHTVDTLLAEDFPASVKKGRQARLLVPIAAARRIAQRAAHYEVVVIHEPSAMAYILARKWNVALPPCVVMSHGVEQRCWDLNAEKMPRSWKAKLFHPVTELAQANYSLRHADAVVCLSSEDAEFIERRLGVPAARIHRMSNGVEADRFAANWMACAQPNLLFAGSWIPRKGTREFVQAFAELRRARPELRVTVLGTGCPAESVRADFAPADRAAVDVLASVSREELRALLARDQIFVLPSHFEGMPLTLLEAMAAGLPCVTTNTCGMRDLVTDGRDGFLFPAGDVAGLTSRVQELLSSDTLRRRVGSAARETARRNTWDAVASKWEPLLESVTRTRPNVSSSYDRWHEEVAQRDDLEADLNNPWYSFARSQLSELEGRTVVEAACGRGQFLAWLKKNGARAVGLDLSLGALRIAQTRMGRNGGEATLLCGDAQALPLRTGSADLVVSCETLEHVPEPRACLRELRRVLRPGGKLILTTENYLNIWGLYRLYIAIRRRRYNSGDCPQPIENWMFSPGTRRMVRQAGFRIVRTDGECHHLLLLPGVNPPDLEAHFLSRVPLLRRAFRYLARHFFVVAEAL